METKHLSYQRSLFTSDELPYWADLYLSVCPKDVTHLACTGSSGLAIATAMICRVEPGRVLKTLYIRKEGEKTHGGKIVNSWANIGSKIAIVDDFIDYGTTMERLIPLIENAIAPVSYIIVARDNSSGFRNFLKISWSHIKLFVIDEM